MKNKSELKIGEIFAMYFDQTALRLPTQRVYRLQTGRDRVYFTLPEPEDQEPMTEAEQKQLFESNQEPEKKTPQFYIGVTTLTSKTLPTSPFLMKWYGDLGTEAANEYTNERASYGTLMHTLFAHYAINRKIDLNTIPGIVAAYIQKEKVKDENTGQWANDIAQDLLAFDQWIKDYKVIPIAIEITLADPKTGIAGTVDFPCMITREEKGFWGEEYKSGENKGKPKETKKEVTRLAFVDFKSGRKSYNGILSASAQLRLYKKLFEANYPEIDTTDAVLYNWSPKEWRSNPDYHFTEQTDAFSDRAAEMLIDLYKELYPKDISEKTRTVFQGTLEIDKENTENYTIKQLAQMVEEWQTQDPENNTKDTEWYLNFEDLLAEATKDEITEEE